MESTKHNGCYGMVMLGNLFHVVLVKNALLFYWLSTMESIVAAEPTVVLFSSLLWLLQCILQLCYS